MKVPKQKKKRGKLSCKYWIKQNDKLWSNIIHLIFEEKDFIVDEKLNDLHPHHWHYNRTEFRLRWEILNGVLLNKENHNQADSKDNALFEMKLYYAFNTKGHPYYNPRFEYNNTETLKSYLDKILLSSPKKLGLDFYIQKNEELNKIYNDLIVEKQL